MLVFALYHKPTGKFVSSGETVKDFKSSKVLDLSYNSPHIYPTKEDVDSHLGWFEYWSQTPEVGPKVNTPSSEFKIVEIEVDFKIIRMVDVKIQKET